jgi:hypothetical protein
MNDTIHMRYVEIVEQLRQASIMARQQEINFKYLLNQIDEIHAVLCPGKVSTWQGRAEQALDAAKKIRAAQTKQCPSCFDADLVGVPTCPKCGYFERQESY